MASAPGMPMCPVPGSTGSAPPALRSFRPSLGYPSLLPIDSKRLEWQFSDRLSSNQNKVRHVTKESQGMDLAWGISPKFEGLSDCVCFWHQADVQTVLMNVRFEGNNGHDAEVARCLLMTQSGHDIAVLSLRSPVRP